MTHTPTNRERTILMLSTRTQGRRGAFDHAHAALAVLLGLNACG